MSLTAGRCLALPAHLLLVPVLQLDNFHIFISDSQTSSTQLMNKGLCRRTTPGIRTAVVHYLAGAAQELISASHDREDPKVRLPTSWIALQRQSCLSWENGSHHFILWLLRRNPTLFTTSLAMDV